MDIINVSQVIGSLALIIVILKYTRKTSKSHQELAQRLRRDEIHRSSHYEGVSWQWDKLKKD